MNAIDRLKKNRWLWLVVILLTADLAMMGPAMERARSLGSLIDQPWCWISAFSSTYGRADVFILAMACSQIALLTTWSFFSTWMRPIRGFVWLGGVLLWSLSLLCVHSGLRTLGYNLFDLSLLFGFQSLGLLVGLFLLTQRRYVLTCGGVSTAKDDSRRQYSLTELLAFFAVAAAVCLIVSWLNAIWGFRPFLYYWNYELSLLARQSAQALTLGLLGSVAVWACLTEKRVVARVFAVLMISGLLGWAVITATLHYQNYIRLSSRIEMSARPAWVVWFFLTAALQIVLLFVVRGFGYRLVTPTEHDVRSRSRLQRWVARAKVPTIAACSLAVLLYFALVVYPEYRANRQLLKQTEHIGYVSRPWHTNTLMITLRQPLDAEVADALRRHGQVTHLQIYGLTEDDGTLEQLAGLPNLQWVRLSRPQIPDERVRQLERQLPNTSIEVWRPDD